MFNMERKKQRKGILLQVAQLGNPVLRKKAKDVGDVKDEKIQSLIDNLTATIMDVNGIGLAAPQVYQSLRIFVLASHPNPRYPNAPKMRPTAVINPRIISTSREKNKDWEGCLSIPGVRAVVSRYKSIKVEFETREGKRVKRKFADFIAMIFQHEYDHLDGIVFLDRLKSPKDIITEKEYQKIMAKQKKSQL